MFKKIASIALASALCAMAVMAEEAAAPAPTPTPLPAPKVGIELSQTVGAETNNGAMQASSFYSANDAEYSQTNLKGSVLFNLGSGLTLTPWAQARLEAKLNPGDLEKGLTYTTAGTKDKNDDLLGTIRFRGRVYGGLNTALAIDKAFVPGLNLEYRYSTDLRTDKLRSNTSTNSTAATGNYTAPMFTAEQVFTPSLNFKGTIDVFYYDLTEAMALNFDTSIGNNDNGTDDFYWQLTGTYAIGFKLPIDKTTTLKLEIKDVFDMVSDTNYGCAGYVGKYSSTTLHGMGNELKPTITLIAGDIAPFIGFIMSTSMDYNQNVTANVVGGSFGTDLKAGSLSFNIGVNMGADLRKETTTPWQTTAYASVKIVN